MGDYQTIKEESAVQFTEKRSKFLCYACPVSSETEAVDYVKKISSKHWDAKHNVYAYRLREQQIERYSDDGEPQGTAGIPMLNVLKGIDVKDVVVVITRYFGGILLGTGGLVRAYSHGTKLAIENSTVVKMKRCTQAKVKVDYGMYGKVQGILENNGAIIENTEFLNDVDIIFGVELEKYGSLQKKLHEISSGTIDIQVLGEKYCFLK